MMLGFAIYATRFFFAHLSQPQVAGFGDVVRQLWGDFTYLRLTPSSSSNQEQVDSFGNEPKCFIRVPFNDFTT